MRFVAKQPREGINVSDTHPLVEAGALIAGIGAICLIIALALIFLIEVALYFLPVDKEAQIFADWLPEDLVTISANDERLAETQALIDRLTEHWQDRPYSFRVEIDDSEIANAMALPGGLVIVTQGLLDQVESENELAFVLGHELGHFKNRDHIRALGRAIVFSLFFAAITDSDVGGVGITVADLALRGFSRKQETSADEFGLTIVNAEYGHVNEASRLFLRWDTDGDLVDDIVSYLSTHPNPGDRVEEMRVLAEEKAWRTDGEVTELQW